MLGINTLFRTPVLRLGDSDAHAILLMLIGRGWPGFGMLAIGARGATHVRGKDCVHLDFVEYLVEMNSFLARKADSGQTTRA
jgi:hypothetical protein